MTDLFIASTRLKQAIDMLYDDPPNCIGLVGDRGTGKGYAARTISAKLLQADQSKLDIYPYFFCLDGTAVGINEIRELQTNLQLSVPGQNKIRRVAIIEHFQQLGREAQNALLKTLEEPPLSTMIIATIDNASIVLPTIASRLQLFDVNPVDYSTAAKGFQNYAESEVRRVFNISGGALGLMAGLLQDDESHELLQAIDFAKDVLRQPKFKRIGMIDGITKDKNISVLNFLDGTSRLLYASLKQTISSGQNNISAIRQANHRVKLAVDAIDDINNGAGQKLVLTRLFLAL